MVSFALSRCLSSHLAGGSNLLTLWHNTVIYKVHAGHSCNQVKNQSFLMWQAYSSVLDCIPSLPDV